MSGHRRPASPGVERRWTMAAQAVGLTLLTLVTLFLVYMAMSAV